MKKSPQITMRLILAKAMQIDPPVDLDAACAQPLDLLAFDLR